MILLKTKDNFNKWVERNIFTGDIAVVPYEFPCYARKEVLCWSNETVEAVYLYRSDLKEMLEKNGRKLNKK